jgi:hypothetical protein
VYPVRLEGEEAVPVFKTSGEITSLARADGFFEIPADLERVEADTIVQVVLFSARLKSGPTAVGPHFSAVNRSAVGPHFSAANGSAVGPHLSAANGCPS